VNKGELRSFYKRALENFLPREVLTKPKHGFGLPVDQWFTTFPPLRELAGDCLTDLRRRHYLRPSFLDDCLGVVQGTVDSVPVGNIYDLVTLELWLQAHADK
jgi:asparagine synthase (glutamine-hydrolysing)